MPLVSVIVSLHNHARYLPRCVESALAQTFGDLEVVIVDDASTDDSLETARALLRLDPRRVVLYANALNQGVSRTRNYGVYKSSGSILAFLDADDAWREDKLERQVRALRGPAGAGLVHTGVRVLLDETSAAWAQEELGMSPERLDLWAQSFRAFGRAACGFDRLDYFGRLLAGNNVCLSSVALSRQVFKKARGFVDVPGSQSEDWLLWLKCSLLTDFCCLEEELTDYRFHPSSHTAQVFLRPDFDQAGLQARVLREARRFAPELFDEQFARWRLRSGQTRG